MKSFLPLLLALSLAGCSAHAADSGDASGGAASAHVRLAGDVTMDRDVAVDMCAVAPPGDGLLSGYQMAAKTDDSIALLQVRIKDFSKDGSYGVADKTQEGQVAQMMATGSGGPLTLMVMSADSKVPVALMVKPQSKLDITISENGTKGDAEFTDLEAPNISEPTAAHGKIVSGSVTWSCAKVERLNSKMNDAVNGMFKSLIH